MRWTVKRKEMVLGIFFRTLTVSNMLFCLFGLAGLAGRVGWHLVLTLTNLPYLLSPLFLGYFINI